MIFFYLVNLKMSVFDVRQRVVSIEQRQRRGRIPNWDTRLQLT